MSLVFLGIGVGIVLVVLVEVLISYIQKHKPYDVSHREEWFNRIGDDDELQDSTRDSQGAR